VKRRSAKTKNKNESNKNGTHQNNVSRNSADADDEVYADAGLKIDVDSMVRSEKKPRMKVMMKVMMI
jgi:hypothetical protein